jgi:hypothetical protein
LAPNARPRQLIERLADGPEIALFCGWWVSTVSFKIQRNPDYREKVLVSDPTHR